MLGKAFAPLVGWLSKTMGDSPAEKLEKGFYSFSTRDQWWEAYADTPLAAAAIALEQKYRAMMDRLESDRSTTYERINVLEREREAIAEAKNAEIRAARAAMDPIYKAQDAYADAFRAEQRALENQLLEIRKQQAHAAQQA